MPPPIWTHDRLRPGLYKPSRDEPKVFEQKFDGLRITFFRQEDGRLVAYGRQIEDHLEKLKDLEAPEGREWLSAIKENLPPLSSLDGEIWAPGVPCTSVITRVKERHPELRFSPFAVPYCRRLWYGHSPFEEADEIIRSIGLEPPVRYEFDPEIHTEKWLLAEARRLGTEGFVLKGFQYAEWWKIKKTDTVDAVLMGIGAGKRGNLGRTGGLIVGLWHRVKPDEEGATFHENLGYHAKLVELTRVGTGLSIEDRETITKDDIGRVVEVEYQAVAGKGRLAHPRYIRFRDDKLASECTIDQLPSRETNDD